MSSREVLSALHVNMSPVRPDTISKIGIFHKVFGHPLGEHPSLPPADLRTLRIRMLAEELGELAIASGVQLILTASPEAAKAQGNQDAGVQVSAQAVVHADVDLFEIARESSDLQYVLDGTFHVYGLPKAECVAEVHRANMSKLDEMGRPIYRSDGKVMKGPNYTPPNMEHTLRPFVQPNEVMRIRFEDAGGAPPVAVLDRFASLP